MRQRLCTHSGDLNNGHNKIYFTNAIPFYGNRRIVYALHDGSKSDGQIMHDEICPNCKVDLNISDCDCANMDMSLFVKEEMAECPQCQTNGVYTKDCHLVEHNIPHKTRVNPLETDPMYRGGHKEEALIEHEDNIPK